MWPKASIIWVNYNSKNFIEVVFRSLHNIMGLDYPNYEVIIVDNHSTDGSFEAIKNFVEHYHKVKVKLIQLRKNLGFTGGNNVGFAARDPDSKYIVLINNDAVPEQSSLKNIIEFMEIDPRVGAGQGIQKTPSGVVDTYGNFIDEALITHALFRGYDPRIIPSKPLFVTYVSGAYAIYKVKAILESRGVNKIFHDFGFAYFDDNVLGLELWNNGWMCRAYPVEAGVHLGSETFKRFSLLKLYLSARNLYLLRNLTNSRYKNLIPLFIARELLTRGKDTLKDHVSIKMLTITIKKAFKDARKTSEALKRNGYTLDIYKAPIVKTRPKDIIYLLTLRRQMTKDISETLLHSQTLQQLPNITIKTSIN